ncbi:hypothetical protein Adt_03795 [Abeliophyllum distichum]|uniref:Uncharacterized protein n=1 Tax=Abeliophyllum distichum TaxID=126358 RepID=A0ABD1VZH9_9LAMI
MYITLLGLDGMLERAEAKAVKITEDLKSMSSTNTKLSSENEDLQSKVEALTTAEVVRKVKQATLEDVKKVKTKVAATSSQRRVAEHAKIRAKEQVVAAKNNITAVNHDNVAMVTEKERLLVKAWEEVSIAKEWLESVKTLLAKAKLKGVR